MWLTSVNNLVSGNWGLSSVADPVAGSGGGPSPPPTLIFKPNGGPKGRKNFLGDRALNYLRVSMTTWTIASVSKVSIVANTFKGSSGVWTSSIHVTIVAVIFAFINICLGSERESDRLLKGRVAFNKVSSTQSPEKWSCMETRLYNFDSKSL